MRAWRYIIGKIVGTVCALFLLACCAVVIYDFCSPWPVASRALERFGRQYRFCIGMGGDSIKTVSASGTNFISNRQRTFILVSAPISWPRFVAVSQDQDGKVTINENVFGFWLWLAFIFCLAWGAWGLALKPFFKTKPPDTTK